MVAIVVVTLTFGKPTSNFSAVMQTLLEDSEDEATDPGSANPLVEDEATHPGSANPLVEAPSVHESPGNEDEATAPGSASNEHLVTEATGMQNLNVSSTTEALLGEDSEAALAGLQSSMANYTLSSLRGASINRFGAFRRPACEAASSSTAAAPVYTSHESVAALTVDPQGHSGSDVAAQGSLPGCFFGPARDNFFFDDVAVGVPHAAHPTVLSGDQEDTDIPIPDPSSSSSAPMPASHEEIDLDMQTALLGSLGSFFAEDASNEPALEPSLSDSEPAEDTSNEPVEPSLAATEAAEDASNVPTVEPSLSG